MVYQKKSFGVLVFHHSNVALQPQKLPLLASAAEHFMKGLIGIFVKACQTASAEVVHHLLPLLLLQASDAKDAMPPSDTMSLGGGMPMELGNGGSMAQPAGGSRRAKLKKEPSA